MFNFLSKNKYSTVPKSKTTIEALWRLQKIILDTLDFNEVVHKIVDGLLSELNYLKLGYRIVVLTLVDEDKQVLKRIALSNTEEAGRAVTASPIPFNQIDIPLNSTNNLLVKTLNEQKPNSTHDWVNLFVPALSAEAARSNQTAAGILTSLVYPIVVKDKSIGVLIFSLVKSEKEVSEEEKELLRGFTDIVGLAIQNSKLYSSQEILANKLKNANQRLQELDKMKDEFVSLASHELRTPMTAIKSYIWLFLQSKNINLDDKQRTYIERAYQSTDRLINLVNDMLNVSRIESGRMNILINAVNITNLVSEVIEELKPTAQKQSVNLTLNLPNSPLPNVLADQNKIREVLINLVGNSLKFTPVNGNIDISLNYDDNMIYIKVKDNGAGIKSEDLPKLFHKFQTVGNNYLTKVNSQGTGLGLYLSKSIVELHGGKIWAESEGEGKGTTFTFSLKKEMPNLNTASVSNPTKQSDNQLK